VRRVYLEQGWNSYGVSIPKALLRDGANHVGLHFSDTADWHGVDSGRRPSIVAFDTMQFIPDGVD
jgi:hypothetical protein